MLLSAGGLLSGGGRLSAQERVWNKALDRYEYVCGRCAEWRTRLNQGKPVPRDSLRMLSDELTEIKKNLQYALVEMTPGQRRRFEAIRDWFTTGEWPADETDKVESAAGFTTAALQSPLEMTNRFPVRPVMTATPSSNSTKVPIRVGGIAGMTAGVYPDLSYGILAGISLDNWGIFIKGRSNFHARKTSYDCLSDGTTSDGGYFWSGDARTVNRHQITFDVSYAFCKPVSLYLGAGFGARTLCWKDSDGDWARVRDRSYRNVAIDAGLLIHPIQKGPAQGLTFLVGGSWIPRKYFDCEAGLAWRF